MLEQHWALENKFEHFGRSDIDILGWDAIKPGQMPLLNFNSIDAKFLMNQLPDSIIREIYPLAYDNSITVDAFRHVISNRTAATNEFVDQALCTLHNEKELEILDPQNIPRQKSYQNLKPTDQIVVPRQMLFPGLSRLERKEWMLIRVDLNLLSPHKFYTFTEDTRLRYPAERAQVSD